MQNFDPLKLAADVANLSKELGDIKAIVCGDASFNLRDFLEAGDAAARLAGDFEPRVAVLEMQIAPFLPLLEPLQELFAGKVAGAGATQASGELASAEDFAATDPAKKGETQ